MKELKMVLFTFGIGIAFYFFNIAFAVAQGWIEESYLWTDFLPTQVIPALLQAIKGPPKYLQPGGTYTGYGPLPFIGGIFIGEIL